MEVLVVSGAGFSINAGSKPSLLPSFTEKLTYLISKVPDFQTMQKSGHVSFDRFTYESSTKKVQSQATLNDVWKLSVQATPTVIHIFMDKIANNCRLLRHYRHNIDFFEQCLPHLRKEPHSSTAELMRR